MDTIDVCIASATIQYTTFISNQHSNIALTGRMQKLSFQTDFWLTLVNQCTNGTSSPIGCDGTNENREYREKKKQQKEIPCVQEPKQIN